LLAAGISSGLSGSRFPEASRPDLQLHLRAGVRTRLAAVPGWKWDADFVFVQACFDLEALLRWRENIDLDLKVYAAVLVPPSLTGAEVGCGNPGDLGS
jgi:hypothetical protein